jgi:peptidoglycan/LPS O-acetylase OafA/YrhL
MRVPKISNSSRSKVLEIEGIRSIAMLMVLSFHFFARWNPPAYKTYVYPYEFQLASEILQNGYLGVQLFFMVSGFVILKSLENQKNIQSFGKARIKRI